MLAKILFVLFVFMFFRILFQKEKTIRKQRYFVKDKIVNKY